MGSPDSLYRGGGVRGVYRYSRECPIIGGSESIGSLRVSADNQMFERTHNIKLEGRCPHLTRPGNPADNQVADNRIFSVLKC